MASFSSPFSLLLIFLLPPSFPSLPLLPFFLLLLLHSYKWKVIVYESEFSQHRWDSYTHCDCCWTIGTLGEEISQRETPLLLLLGQGDSQSLGLNRKVLSFWFCMIALVLCMATLLIPKWTLVPWHCTFSSGNLGSWRQRLSLSLLFELIMW